MVGFRHVKEFFFVSYKERRNVSVNRCDRADVCCFSYCYVCM